MQAQRGSLITVGGPTAINLRISKRDDNLSELAYTEVAPKRKLTKGKRPGTANQRSALTASHLNETFGGLPTVTNNSKLEYNSRNIYVPENTETVFSGIDAIMSRPVSAMSKMTMKTNSDLHNKM